MKGCKNIMRIKLSNLVLSILLLVISAIGLFYLYFIGNSQLEEIYPSIQFFADSNTYIKTFRGEGNDGAIIRIDGNYLGPLIVLSFFRGNNYLILIFNFFIFAYSIISIAKALKINSLHVALILLISPLTFSNLLSVNKEIFLYPFFALALSAYIRKSIMLLLFALFLSLMVRWQLTVFYVVMIVAIKWRSVFRTRIEFVLYFLIAISIVYILIQPIIQPILLYVQLSNESYDSGGTGLFERTMEMQNNGLYFLAFPIKAFHLLFGMGFKFDRLFNPFELYNDFFVGGHCAITFVMFTLLAFKRKLSLRSDLFFIAVIFLIVFCVTPIFAPRYLYFFFFLGALVLAGAPDDLQKLQTQKNITPYLIRN